MKITTLTLPQYIEDAELVKSVSEIMSQVVDKIYIAEDMNDAIRDGYEEGIHKVLSDGRVVWLTKLINSTLV